MDPIKREDQGESEEEEEEEMEEMMLIQVEDGQIGEEQESDYKAQQDIALQTQQLQQEKAEEQTGIQLQLICVTPPSPQHAISMQPEEQPPVDYQHEDKSINNGQYQSSPEEESESSEVCEESAVSLPSLLPEDDERNYMTVPQYPEGWEVVSFDNLDIQLDLLNWPVIEVARQLTVVEMDFLRAIRPAEFLSSSKNIENRSPNLSAMILRFNRVCTCCFFFS